MQTNLPNKMTAPLAPWYFAATDAAERQNYNMQNGDKIGVAAHGDTDEVLATQG